MIFGFSLYAILLLVILAIYFGSEFSKLGELKPPKGSKVYYYQHQKKISVLINSQNRDLFDPFKYAPYVIVQGI